MTAKQIRQAWGQELRQARLARGWSVGKACAEAGDLSPSTLSRCENHGSGSLEVFWALAHALGWSDRDKSKMQNELTGVGNARRRA